MQVSKNNSPLNGLGEQAVAVDWSIPNLERSTQNSLLSQIFLEIYQQVLKKVSAINRDDLIQRCHKNMELTNLSFFVDTTVTLSRGNARNQAKNKVLA